MLPVLPGVPRHPDAAEEELVGVGRPEPGGGRFPAEHEAALSGRAHRIRFRRDVHQEELQGEGAEGLGALAHRAEPDARGSATGP